MTTWKKDATYDNRWNLVNEDGEVLGRISKYQWGAGWTVVVSGVPNKMQTSYTEVRRLLYPKVARTKAEAKKIILAVKDGRDAWKVRPGERERNPSAEEMLQNHSESWKNVRWDSLEYDEETAEEHPYVFKVMVPCWVPEEEPAGDEPFHSSAYAAASHKIAAGQERRIESAVRHFLARAVTLPTGQRVLPGVRLRPAGVPSVEIEVDLDLGNYTEVGVTLVFDPDAESQTIRDIVSLLDAIDANPAAICPFPQPEEEEEEESPRAANPGPPITAAALVGRLKF